MERRLAGLYESIEAGAGLELADVGSRIRVRQKSLTAASERVIAERGPIAEVSDEEMWRAAAMFKELVQHCEDPPIPGPDSQAGQHRG
ncbi:hypothetical protein [Zoogloea sp. LCSB751]|uniref:hypothetical protein n=1 Tax=Zoogloea sp. LCSB751 TaxID=1965277 RepID=UPI0009A481B9|nr:hypothetical protein [Zoogloea sp. LCSB751]